MVTETRISRHIPSGSGKPRKGTYSSWDSTTPPVSPRIARVRGEEIAQTHFLSLMVINDLAYSMCFLFLKTIVNPRIFP